MDEKQPELLDVLGETNINNFSIENRGHTSQTKDKIGEDK
jgi:hypothetical protein